jgi:hypothetical protein
VVAFIEGDVAKPFATFHVEGIYCREVLFATTSPGWLDRRFLLGATFDSSKGNKGDPCTIRLGARS